MITKTEFLKLARKVATDFRTVYMKGCFGSPVSKALLQSKAAQYPEFYTPAKCQALLAEKEAGSTPLFGFDCVCFVKGLLWGWSGNPNATHGGAVYASNSVPDLSVEQMKDRCIGLSSDFDGITPGELLFMPGHVGIYLGDGLAVECTSKWQGGVLLSGVSNVGFTGPYSARLWQSHGRMPWFEGEDSAAAGNTAGSAGTAAASSEAVEVLLPQLQKGNKGEAVRAMQALLTLRGYAPGSCGNDASFGGDTLTAVKAFQKSVSLYPDGLCGKKTWTALLMAS